MTQFKTRLQGFNTAKRVWACRVCGRQHLIEKPAQCYGCTHKAFDYFASMAEARRGAELRLMQKGGLISQLVLHPAYTIEINKTKICNYVADFAYRDQKQNLIVEDVKSTRTKKGLGPVFLLKQKMFEAQYKIKLTIVVMR